MLYPLPPVFCGRSFPERGPTAVTISRGDRRCDFGKTRENRENPSEVGKTRRPGKPVSLNCAIYSETSPRRLTALRSYATTQQHQLTSDRSAGTGGLAGQAQYYYTRWGRTATYGRIATRAL